VTGWLLSKSILQSLPWWQAGKNLDPVTHRFVSIERVSKRARHFTFVARHDTYPHIATS
jgi:hypothetical protein